MDFFKVFCARIALDELHIDSDRISHISTEDNKFNKLSAKQ